MRNAVTWSLVVALAAGIGLVAAEDPPKAEPAMPIPMPVPTSEHQWLKRFAGEWDWTSTCFLEPGNPPIEAKGSDRARSIGDYWVVVEGEATMLGTQFTSILTLGYDPERRKLVGTWVDSTSSHL